MSLDNLSQCLTSSTVKMFLFLVFKLIFFKFQLMLIASCTITRHHWELVSIFFTASNQVLIHSDKISLAISCPSWTVPSLPASGPTWACPRFYFQFLATESPYKRTGFSPEVCHKVMLLVKSISLTAHLSHCDLRDVSSLLSAKGTSAFWFT